MSWKYNNSRIVYSPGPSQWAFDGDCRWLWLDSVLPLSSSSRIIHTTWIYPRTIYPPFLGFYFFNGLMFLLQALHIFWAGLILRMVIKFLPGNVWTAAFNFPSIRPTTLSPRNQQLCTFDGCFAFLVWHFTWQDIVEDERSDKEETETDEDGGDNRERMEKCKNGHVQNGHTPPLNNNHSKRDWMDCKSWRWSCVGSDDRPLTCGPHLKAKERSVACWEDQQAAHANIHTHLSITQ